MGRKFALCLNSKKPQGMKIEALVIPVSDVDRAWHRLPRHSDDSGLQSGIPGNGKPFPDGAQLAKIHWNPSGTQHDVDLMVKDSKRFAVQAQHRR